MKQPETDSQSTLLMQPCSSSYVSGELYKNSERLWLSHVGKMLNPAQILPSAKSVAPADSDSFADLFILKWKAFKFLNTQLACAAQRLDEASSALSHGSMDELCAHLREASGILQVLLSPAEPKPVPKRTEPQPPKAMAAAA